MDMPVHKGECELLFAHRTFSICLQSFSGLVLKLAPKTGLVASREKPSLGQSPSLVLVRQNSALCEEFGVPSFAEQCRRFTSSVNSRRPYIRGIIILGTLLLLIVLFFIYPSVAAHLARVPASEFPFRKGKPLDGIIAYISGRCSCNPHDEGLITITSKSVFPGFTTDALRNVANLSSYIHFCTDVTPDQWICWDFHEMQITPTHYTLLPSDLWRPKSWIVEGSLDGESWTELDRYVDFPDSGHRIGTFAVTNSAPCRFVRLTQLSRDHGRKHCISIVAVEFFGTLLETRI
jgi:hypothetical protein